MDEGKFKYDTLDTTNGSIRVLHLLPGRWIEDICCELQAVSLDDDPAYDALSYVWGDPQDTGQITVNNSPFQATKNLIAALRRLRSSIYVKVLWVDAICINQQDNDEKARQVGMMARIYKSAADVQVFLGESGILDLIPEEDQAAWDDPLRLCWVRDSTMLIHTEHPPHKIGVEHPMWAIWEPQEGLNARDQQRVDEFFTRQLDAKYGESGKLSPLQRLRDSQAGALAMMKMLSNGRCIKACCQGSFDSPAWTGALEVLAHLVSLPWWSRAWVLQEAILPQRDVLAIYGEIVVPMGLIEDSGAILPRHYERGDCCKRFWTSLPAHQKTTFQKFAYTMGQLEGIRETLGIMKMKEIEMLKYLLDKTRFKEATDPRDKIHGLLGLINNCHDPIDLTPDYNVPVKDLYIKVALQMIDFTSSLSILHHHELRSSPTASELPSWVPSWGPTYGSLTPFQIGERTANFRAWPPGPGKVPHLATGTQYPDALVVEGKLISKIAAVTEPMSKTASSSFLDILTSLVTFFDVDDFTTYRSSAEPATTAWARTLLGDQVFEVRYELKAGQVVFDRAYPGDIQMFRLARQILHAQEVGQELVLVLPDGTIMNQAAKAQVVRHAEENFWYANDGRVFFWTEDGHFGSGPMDAKVGDDVWVVLGSLVPLVLRPITETEDCRQLVGHAYVHGIMDGEAVSDMDGEGKREVYLV
ncbi:putative heterokaryon incompatibility protein [Triangularia verruculosa]|uniref:Heterokaryon incompatibility protein n=1 Tax=Triangularia verruculosa TaxID=2587418 RepID=A0AAN7B070_9PEZI|nr:putative heterokaryon incompatibility protein [Triangularia verruculosa]